MAKFYPFYPPKFAKDIDFSRLLLLDFRKISRNKALLTRCCMHWISLTNTLSDGKIQRIEIRLFKVINHKEGPISCPQKEYDDYDSLRTNSSD